MGKSKIANDPKSYIDSQIDIVETASTLITDIKREPTGFITPESVVVSYDQSTRKVTLSGTVEAYWKGVRISVLTNGWISEAHEATPTSGLFLKYNGTEFSWSSSSWTYDEIQIAYALYLSDGTFIGCQRETHGLMNYQSHLEFHNVTGTYRISGGALSDYTTSSTVATNRRPTISECVIADEDLFTTIPANNTQNSYARLFLSATSTLNFENTQTELPKLNGAIPRWNEFTGGSFQQTDLPNNRRMSYWLFAVPVTADADSQKYRFIFMQGQSNSTSLASEYAKSPSDLNLGVLASLTPEFIFIAQVVILRSGNNWVIEGVRNLTGTRVNYVSAPAQITPESSIILTVGDETTDLTIGTAKLTFRMPYAFTVSEVRASVNTAPIGSTIIVDINDDGTSILSTKLSIDASEKTSVTAISEAVISDSALADDAEITIDIDQVGSSTAGKGLKIALIGRQ